MKSLSVKLGVTVVVMLFSILITPNLFAQEIGRYQAVAIPRIEGDGKYVFIIDTKEGHTWSWNEWPTRYKTDGSLMMYGARQIIYQGKVRPGKKIGDIIEKQDFSQP